MPENVTGTSYRWLAAHLQLGNPESMPVAIRRDASRGRPHVCISQGIYRDGAVWAFYWDKSAGILSDRPTSMPAQRCGLHQSYAADLGGGPMHGAEELMILAPSR